MVGDRPKPASPRGKLVVGVIFAFAIAMGLILVKFRPAMSRPAGTQPSSMPSTRGG